jgi:hypothetical protein
LRVPIPEDLVTAGFLARLLVEKYVLGRPAHRIIAGVVVRRLPGGRGDLGRGAGGGLGPAGPDEGDGDVPSGFGEVGGLAGVS